jgi:hypothetical protein
MNSMNQTYITNKSYLDLKIYLIPKICMDGQGKITAKRRTILYGRNRKETIYLCLLNVKYFVFLCKKRYLHTENATD